MRDLTTAALPTFLRVVSHIRRRGGVRRFYVYTVMAASVFFFLLVLCGCAHATVRALTYLS